jgi:hypothetical protein
VRISQLSRELARGFQTRSRAKHLQSVKKPDGFAVGGGSWSYIPHGNNATPVAALVWQLEKSNFMCATKA